MTFALRPATRADITARYGGAGRYWGITDHGSILLAVNVIDDVQAVAAHELEHAMGLGASRAPPLPRCS